MIQRLLWYSPVALLCTIAIWQIQRAHSSDLTPWKGGGFGMFSTVDQPQMRFVKVFLVDDEGDHPIAVPESLVPAFQRVKADPSERNLQWLADHLAEHGLSRYREWSTPVLDSDSKAASASTSQSESERTTDEGTPNPEFECRAPHAEPWLRVELWRLRFDDERKEIVSYHQMETTARFHSTPN